MTKVHKVAVEAINRGAELGGMGYGVMVYATRNGKDIKTCCETSGSVDAMNKRAISHAKRLGAPVFTA